jgi:hypothetical protein
MGNIMSNFTDYIGGSGGGGSEVNDVKYIASTVDLITTESGEKWQKSGLLTNSDTTTYSDATSFHGNIGTNTDSEVSLADTSTNWSKQWSSCITTNGIWVWNANMGSAAGNNQLFARKLDGTGSQVLASDRPNFTNANGRQQVMAHRDGYFYTLYPVSWSASDGYTNRYHQLDKYSINNSTGVLTFVQTISSSINFGSYWVDSWLPNQVDPDNYFHVIGRGSNNRLFKLHKNGTITDNIKNWATGDATFPADTASLHEFDGKIWVKAMSQGFMYVYTSNFMTFIEKIDVGSAVGGTFFSKTDSTGVMAEDSYSSMASSASGAHNYQRLYQATDAGYKNHPPSTIVGTAQAKTDGTGVTQYMRIL